MKRIILIIASILLATLLLAEDSYIEMLHGEAQAGDVVSQYILGGRYYFGHGVSQDYKQAVKWFRLAADQGDDYAQLYLGLCYDNGEGVVQDHREAVRWYRLAANQGNASAQLYLGLCYDNGEGVVQNKEEAYFWFLLSAANGSDPGLKNRDVLAKELTSAKRDRVRARAQKWFEEHQ